jgi:ectoine hydroxylase-related dioxygenase (phytanoyl-CoA dioxygenase family)
MRAPQVWYALDEMTSANGPIWVQNGSHVQGRRAERPSEPAETHKHYVRLQPGEVFANDGAHGAPEWRGAVEGCCHCPKEGVVAS